MAKYLTQEWLDLRRELARDLPERPGATARLQCVVTGTPGGDVSYVTVIDDGKVVENVLGTDDGAELTLASTYDDAVEILRGELDANAAFMQGRLKVAGDMGRLMSLMPLTQSPEHKAIQAELAEQTEL